MSRLLHLLLFPLLLSAQEPNLSVLPTPREVTRFDASFAIDAETRVVLQDPENELDAFTANQLVEQIRDQFGLALQVQAGQTTTNWDNVIYLGKFGQDAKAEELAEAIDLPEIMDLREEGYYLQIADSLLVMSANSSHGLFNAAMTVMKLLQAATEPQLPGMTLYDYPEMRFRGVSLDLSHGSVPNLQTLKGLIRLLGRYKINACVLYLGAMFEYESHPKIAQGRGALSKSEIRELQSFAKPYHVEIIPAMATLSQWRPILSLPEYQTLSLYPGASSLDPRKEESYQLLEELLAEIADAFASPHIVLSAGPWGADAHPDALQRPNPLPDDQVLGKHWRSVTTVTHNLNRQPILVMNNGPSFFYQLPSDVMLVASPAEHSAYHAKDVVITAPISKGHTPFQDFFRTIADLENMSPANSRLAGMLVTSWSMPFGPAFQQLNRYGFVYAAEAMWALPAVALQDFNRTYFSQRYGDFAEMAELAFLLLADFPADFWQQMWCHPYLAPAAQDLQSRTLRMRTQFQQVLNLLTRATNTESPSLDYLKHTAQHGLWLADKLEIAQELQKLRSGYGSVVSPEEIDALIAKCEGLIEELNAVIEDFQLLWLRSNRMEDSPRFLDLYSLQVAYWQEVISDLETGQLARDPVLPGEWIVHPPVANMGEAARSHAFFRKTFEVTPGFKSASLLAIPDSRMKVYINGAFLDEVVRPELYTGVRVWDIGSVLQPGKNVIAVEAWHDAASAPTAIRIYGEVEYEFGKTLRITTDVYWKTSTQEEADWQKLGFFDVQWLNALPVAKDLTIISPNFRSGRPAMVTR